MIVKNKPKKIRKLIFWLLVCGWVGLLGYSAIYIYKKITHKPGITTVQINGIDVTVDETPITKEQIQEYNVPPTHPRYLSIPKLGINNARIKQIGLLKNTNQLDAPVSIFDAGWYTGSVKPGNGSGAVLIDGHNGGPNYDGIFKKLNQLSVGDQIIIERGDGQKFTYEVRDNRDMLVDEINDANNPYGMSTILNSHDTSKEGLNIITCVGDWLQSDQTYNKRTMLRAVRIQ